MPDELQQALDLFLLDRQEGTGPSPCTRKFYNGNLRPFIAWLRQQGVTTPAQITVVLIQRFAAHHHARSKPSTKHAFHVAVRAWLHLLAEREVIPTAPKWKLPKVTGIQRPFLTGPEVEAVFAACKTNRERAIVATLVASGIRRAELCALRWRDVDLEAGEIHVAAGKGDKSRYAFFNGSARALLKDMVGQPDAPVFTARGGGPLSVAALARILERIGRRAGVKLSAHRLRRSFATLSVRAGARGPMLQRLMGHTDQKTTDVYIQLVRDDLREAYRQADPLGGLKLEAK